MAEKIHYSGNPNLKKIGVKLEYTEEQILEIAKCTEDIIYFIENYCYIVTLDHGIQLFKLWDFQKDFLKIIHNNRMVIGMLPRQQSKCLEKNTIYTVRNKTTSEVKNISAENFHKLLHN